MKLSTFFFILFSRYLFTRASLESRCQPLKNLQFSDENTSALIDSTAPAVAEVDFQSSPKSKNIFEFSSNSENEGGLTKIYSDPELKTDQISNEIAIHKKLSIFFPEIVPNFFSCNLIFSGQEIKEVLLNFENFYPINSEIYSLKRSKMNISSRIKLYSALSKTIRVLHQNNIVHCALNMNTIGSTAIAFEKIQINDFSQAVDLSERPIKSCAKRTEKFQSKDFKLIKCRSKDEVFSADVWDIGFFILLNELGDQTLLKNFIKKESREFEAGQCFEGIWSPNCETLMTKLIDFVFRSIIKRTKEEVEMAYYLKEIVKTLFYNCEKRPNAKQLTEKLNELVFKKLTLKQKPEQSQSWFEKLFCCMQTESPKRYNLNTYI